MNNQKTLQLSAESPEQPIVLQATSAQNSMQQWLDAALSSSDARDRIAVTAGISRGVFGYLHLGGSDELSPIASNDSDYSDEIRSA